MTPPVHRHLPQPHASAAVLRARLRCAASVRALCRNARSRASVHPWLLALLLVCAMPTQAQSGASGWWRTADQRGDAALRAGDAATAARTYTDPRRRAYAQARAGDHQGAAAGYALLDDAESAYNRGNALARAGELRSALQAYDAALAKNPNDVAAQRNRALVEKAIGQPPPLGGLNNGQAKGPSPVAGGPAAQQRAASAAPGPRGPDQPGPGSGPGDARAAPATTPNASTAQPPMQPAQPGTPPARLSMPPTGGAAAPPSAAQKTPPQNGPPRAEPAAPATADDAAQARSDLARFAGPPALAASAAARGGAPPQSDAGQRNPARKPPTEQQLAEDQWLRRLPDDASGLLRRKFLIQHMIREGDPPP
jgi:Ca-activated chloride channel homolog